METTSEIRIQAAPTPDPATFRFTVSRVVFGSNEAVYYDGPESAADSPLGPELFDLDGVIEVYVSGNTVDVTASSEDYYPQLAKGVGAAIRRALSEMPEPSRLPEFERDQTAEEKALMQEIQIVMDTEINPMIAMHGGVARVMDLREKNLYLEMGGGCQGCGMAAVTLKQGIERLVREHFPQIEQILDTTDHAAGTNPYYSPGGH